MSVYTTAGTEIFAVYDIDRTNLKQAYDIEQYPLLKTGGEFGVEWDYSASSPVLTRTLDAAGFSDPVPATSLAESGSSPFDNIMPWAGMRMCNIIDGEVAYWQGDPQFSETDYDTMVYIPEFWYKAEKNTDTQKWSWSISPTEREGYEKHPGSNRYIGRFHSSGGSSGVYSKSGVTPWTSVARANGHTYSHNKGAKWWMLDIATWSAMQILYLVEFANFNSQGVLGDGQNSGNLKANGATSGAVYHTLKRSKDSNQYRWLENPFSNLDVWIDGVAVSSKAVYVGLDNASFANSTNSLMKTGITLPSEGYINDFGYSSVCPYAFIPSGNTGSIDTYVTDGVSSRTSTRFPFTGGANNTKGTYGFFYFDAYYDASFTSGYFGSRLIFIP